MRKDQKGKRYQALGRELLLSEWAALPVCVVSHSALKGRVRRGWDLIEAMTTPEMVPKVKVKVKKWGRTVGRNPRPPFREPRLMDMQEGIKQCRTKIEDKQVEMPRGDPELWPY